MTAPLELVTFEELVERITEFRDRAQAENAREGWAKLLDIASGRAGRDTADDDITAGRTWYLTRVRISGYQGIGDRQPLEISFSSTPGVTVIHGPNGSGKSSIADAIKTALQGHTRPAALEGRGGNAPIWERIHLGRDADEAVIELTLLAGNEALRIRCAVGGEDETVRYSATHSTGSAEHEIDLAETRWMSAVTGHRPVYAYAVVERQVQVAKNLQQFLEGLLAFGSCFNALEREVQLRSQGSFEAKRTLDAALSAAQQRAQSVDTDWSSAGQAQLGAITWPSTDEDPDEWLEREGLTEAGQALPQVTAEDLSKLRATAGVMDEELTNLRAAETSVHAQLLGPLKDLHEVATQMQQPGTACPVCGTPDVPWVDRLGDSIEGLVELRSIQQSCRTAVSAFREVARQCLDGVRAVLTARDENQVDLIWWDDVVRPFFDAEQNAGNRVTTGLRSTAAALTFWVGSSDCEQLVSGAATESDYRRQWSRARRASVDDFVSTWRSVAAEACESPAWASAKLRLKDLQNALRRERAGMLGTQTNAKVQALLADAGVTLKSITIQDRQAALEVVDHQDKPLLPAMLSAGQRNALLLAPMLAVSGGGPFGFVVLDDPVHAFDQVRVDQLASAIADLAGTRRVVVLTHDERLKEHLLAQQPDCDVLAAQRDPATGAVSAAVEGGMWQTLLDDAFGVVNTAANPPGNVTRPPHDIVRGLCRQAFDNALRSFVIRAAVQDGRTPEPELAALDKEDRTRQRVTAVREFFPSGSSHRRLLDGAELKINLYLDDWNRAVHGNEPAGAHDPSSLRAEIQAAKQACRVLTGEST